MPKRQDKRRLLWSEEDAPAGGGGAPAWVPVGAKIAVDFMVAGGRAWVDGVGLVAVDTLLGNDPASGTSGYDPTKITVHGYQPTSLGMPVAAIGALRTALVGPVTYRLQTKDVSPAVMIHTVLDWSTTSGDFGLRLTRSGGVDLIGESFEGVWSRTLTGVFVNTANQINVFAVTLTNTRAEMSANGSAASADVLTEAERPTSGPNAIISTRINVTQDDTALQSIATYTALPSTAGLPGD